MGLRRGKLQYFGWLKNLIFRGRQWGSGKPNTEGDCLKRGVWTVCRFKGELGKEEGGGVLEGGLVHYIKESIQYTENKRRCCIKRKKIELLEAETFELNEILENALKARERKKKNYW